MAHAAARDDHITPEEYLALERQAETKSEYYDGQRYAMSGASRAHNLITLNMGGELRTQLRQRPCEVYPSDMRVKVAASGLYTYPDVAVVCDEPQFEDDVFDTLLNPTLLVEVLSPSTAGYDRGAKFDFYRALESLQTVLFVAQDRPHVVRYERQDDASWLLTETEDPTTILPLPALGIELSMTEIYAKVTFVESQESEGRHPAKLP